MTSGDALEIMRVVQFDEYGGPGVLKLRNRPVPMLRAENTVVRVLATTVNQHDVFVRSGRLRIATGGRFPLGIGVDFSGEVVSTGASGTYQPGDLVWGTMPGLSHRTSGTAADYVSVRPEQVSRTPRGMSFTEAASMIAGGTAALTALKHIAAVGPGDRVLIRGGTGTVGNFAVQYAHAIGAHVTAIVGSQGLELAEKLGADLTLDKATRASELGQFDVILDTVGSNMRPFRQRLARGGRMVTVAFSSLPAIAYLAASTVHGSKRVRSFLGSPKSADLDLLATTVTEMRIVPLISTVYPLEDIAEAHRAVEARGVIGKHVIQLATDPLWKGRA